MLLEKDRRTITKAMLGIAPDTKVNGQSRWRLRKIVDALAAQERPAAGSNSAAIDPDLAKAYAQFDAAFAAMEAAPSLEMRRAMAVKAAPLIADIDRQLRAHGRAIGVGDELADYRALEIWRLTLLGFEKPCGWSRSECQQHLDAA
jgi:hypothetical protein